jgi:hypothetical protein
MRDQAAVVRLRVERLPAGLAGWIIEHFRGGSDCGGDVETRFNPRPRSPPNDLGVLVDIPSAALARTR